MDFLKKLFEGGALTWEQFSDAVGKNGFKLVNLSEGKHINKQKYDEDIAAKDNQINTLNSTIEARDKDLKQIKKQLEEAGADKDKLTTLSNDLSALQTKYSDDVKKYQEQLSAQAYEFAVKEFANEQKFTCGAAKRDFIRSMIDKQLKIEDNKIIGATDFLKSYKTENADSFAPENNVQQGQKTPQFVQSTNPQQTSKDTSKMTYSQMVAYMAENPEAQID